MYGILPKGPSRHAYAWQIGPFWQDTLDMQYCISRCVFFTGCVFTSMDTSPIWPLLSLTSDWTWSSPPRDVGLPPTGPVPNLDTPRLRFTRPSGSPSFRAATSGSSIFHAGSKTPRVATSAVPSPLAQEDTSTGSPFVWDLAPQRPQTLSVRHRPRERSSSRMSKDGRKRATKKSSGIKCVVSLTFGDDEPLSDFVRDLYRPPAVDFSDFQDLGALPRDDAVENDEDEPQTLVIAPIPRSTSPTNKPSTVTATANSPRQDLQQVHIGDDNRTCLACNKTYAHRSTLRAHIRDFHGGRQHRCDTCGKHFRSIQSRLRHQKSSHGTDDKPYKCPSCGRTFRDSTTLGRHLRTHTGSRPFRCDMCGRGFTQSGNLRRHERTHRD